MKAMDVKKTDWRIPLVRLFFVCWILFILFLAPGIRKYLLHFRFGLTAAAIGAVLIMICFLLFAPRIERWSESRYRTIFFLVLFCMFGLLLLAGRLLLARPYTDAGTVYFSVAEIVENGAISKEINEFSCCAWSTHTSNNEYFLIYPKSLFLVAYLVPYMKLGADLLRIDLYSPAGWYFLIILNCLSLTVSAAAIAHTARLLRGKAAGLLCLCLSAVFLPYYLSTYRVYSDTLSIPYVSLSFLFLAKGDLADDSTAKRILYRCLTGVTLALATLLKGSVLVLVVAVFIYLFLRSSEQACTLKSRIADIAALGLTILLITSVWGRFAADCPWLDQTMRERYELPSMHWIMMAAEGHGGYRQESLDYSLSFKTIEERKKAETEAYIRAVRKKNAEEGGFAGFLYEKMCKNLAEGRFYQQQHMNHCFDATKGIGKIVHADGVHYHKLMRILAAYPLLFWLGFLFSAILSVRKRCVDEQFLIAECAFGLFLFFCLWEFKSRYLMNFTPMFFLGIVLAVCDLHALLKKHS